VARHSGERLEEERSLDISRRLTTTNAIEEVSMKTRKLRPLLFVLAFLALIFVHVPPAQALYDAGGSCVTRWRQCRDEATRAFFDGYVDTIRLSLLYDGCDIGYIWCSINPWR